MFYSHQLLNKKGPMGQIWIAATIRAHINRRKAATIDIEQICKQILYPPVPLALRLSGILMGGVVHVYNRKVVFLYEDLNAFLKKIKTEVAGKGADPAILPSPKRHAKFENITIDYGFTLFDDNEQPMSKQPVPGEEEDIMEEQFFVFPNVGKLVDGQDDGSPRDHFQAAIEDITLLDPDPYSPQNVDGTHRSGSSTSCDDILAPLDDFLPDFQLPDNLPPNLSGALHTIFEENLPEPDVNPPEETATLVADSQPKRHTRPKRIRSKKLSRGEIYDDDATEVPPRVYKTWLRETSDVIDRSFPRKISRPSRMKKLGVAAVQQVWTLPSACVSLNASYGPEPAWAPTLQEMWRSLISVPSYPVSGMRKAILDVKETSLPSASLSDPGFPMETDNSPPEFDPVSHLGSVEKLREALQTPSTGSQEVQYSLRTPSLLAPVNVSGISGNRRKSSWSTPHSEGLLCDSEGDLPTSGRSKKRRSSSVKPGSPCLSGELPEIDLLPPRASGKCDMIDYFASGDFQAGILAQSQLLEETAGCAQTPMPADSINTTTIVLAKHLREHFNKLEAADISEASLDKLTRGLDQSRAARMFYQVCGVLSLYVRELGHKRLAVTILHLQLLTIARKRRRDLRLTTAGYCSLSPMFKECPRKYWLQMNQSQ